MPVPIDRPLVSVVIPTRDRPQHLLNAIASVNAQTYEPIEIIVVDDASVEPVSLNEVKGRTLKLLRMDRPSGSGAARNEGARHASGELIAFLDDDDRWLPEHLAPQVTALSSAGSDVAAVETGHEGWRDGRLLYSQRPSLDRKTRVAILKEPRVFTSSVLIRKEHFDEVGGFDPELRRHQDWVLWARLFQRFELLSLDQVSVRREIDDWVTGQDRLDAYEALRKRLDPLIARLQPRERLEVTMWHLRTSLIRKGHDALSRVGAGWVWTMLKEVQRMVRRGVARLRGKDPRTEVW